MRLTSLDAAAFLIATTGVLAVAAVIASATSFMRRKREVMVERIVDPIMAPATQFRVLVDTQSIDRPKGVVATVADIVSRIARPASKDEVARIRARLYCGGFRGDNAVSYFLGTKVVLAFSCLGVGLWLNARRMEGAQPTLLLAIVTFAIGFYFPDLYLRSRVATRQKFIERGLPDALDLLVTCVEAGLGLDAALQRVAGDVRQAWPVLGDELLTCFLEIKAGMPRVEAFRRLATRTGVADLKSLAATLNQTETFGTSIALALRVQAEGIRVRRMQRAEERAGYAAVKMTIPMIMCILPALLALVVGPALVNIMKTLIKGN